MLMLIILESLDFKLLTSLDDNFTIEKLQKGDLILRKVLVPGKKFLHAGIYCGENEIIHFISTGRDLAIHSLLLMCIYSRHFVNLVTLSFFTFYNNSKVLKTLV